MTSARLIILVGLLLPGAACGSSPTSPSSTTSTTTSTTTSYNFEATLAPGETTFYSFKVTTAGAVTVTLASIVRPSQFSPVPVHMRVGLGIPAGEGCAVTESVDVTPALTAQISTTREAGIFCVSVADIGELTGTVITSVRYTHS